MAWSTISFDIDVRTNVRRIRRVQSYVTGISDDDRSTGFVKG
jgi:hypothetical protein